jgi:transcriptional regulator with XRE-family HTH domain
VAAEVGVNDHAEQARPERTANRPFAEKLERLFQVMHEVGKKPHSTREIARRTERLHKQDRGVVPVTATYIGHLRNGDRSNPSMEAMNSIAAAFGVSAGYFTNDPEIVSKIDRELDELEEFHRNPLAALAAETALVRARTANLDAMDRAKLDRMVKAFMKQQGAELPE